MVLNVKDYGAKGDGVTLDTRAILDAINACNNGVVYLPDRNDIFKKRRYAVSV